jgi:hypothetical protein
VLLIVDPRGVGRCLYTEVIDLAALGRLSITRASTVEPDAGGSWLADLSPAGGPVFGPYPRRSEALAAERAWLEQHRLVPGATAAPP